jgi:hypothetical protein
MTMHLGTATRSIPAWILAGALLTTAVGVVWAVLPDSTSARRETGQQPLQATLAGNGVEAALQVLAAAQDSSPFEVRVPAALPAESTALHASKSESQDGSKGQIDFTYGFIDQNSGLVDFNRPLIHSYQSNQNSSEKPSQGAADALTVDGRAWQLRRLEYPQPGGRTLIMFEIEHTFEDGVQVFFDTRVVTTEEAAVDLLAQVATSLK